MVFKRAVTLEKFDTTPNRASKKISFMLVGIIILVFKRRGAFLHCTSSSRNLHDIDRHQRSNCLVVSVGRLKLE